VRLLQLKRVGPMIQRNIMLGEMLRGAHTTPGDSALQAKIRQGAATFAEDIRAATRIKKPVLWFLK